MAIITKLGAIADAVRAKAGITGELTIDEMAAALGDLEAWWEPTAAQVQADYSDSSTDGSAMLYPMSRLENQTATKLSVNFQRITQLQSVSLPACTSVGDYAFMNCTNLAEVDMPLLETVGSQAFYNSAITSASFPKCTSVGDGAFNSCKALKKASLPLFAGRAGFSSCSSLTSVDLPKAWKVVDSGFLGCSSLTSVDLPACTSVGTYAFSGCSSLTSVSLKALTSVDATNSYLFNNCTSLKYVYLGPTVPSNFVVYSSNGVFGSKYQTMLEQVTFYVPSSAYSKYKAKSNWSSSSINISTYSG